VEVEVVAEDVKPETECEVVWLCTFSCRISCLIMSLVNFGIDVSCPPNDKPLKWLW